MRVLVVAACLLAVASAGFLPGAYHGHARVGVFDQNGYKIDDAPAAVAAPLAVAAPVAYAAHYAGPHHLPVIGPHGVPLDTPAVAAAKASHAAAHVEATVRNAAADGVAVVAPAAGVVAPLAYAGYAGPHHLPVIGANGVPLDTPAVVAAKASHAAAHVEATARNAAAAVADGVAVVAHHGLVAHGYAAPVLAHGVPVDTPAVAAAKAAHLAAHVDAKVRAGILHPLVHYRRRRGVFAGLHHPAGVTVAHGASVVAAGRAAVYDQNGYQIDEAPVAVAGPVAAPLAYAAHFAGHHHLPVIGPNGVPLDTPAVAAAKAGHAAAHVEAVARNAAADVADSVEVVAAPAGAVVGGAFVGPVGRVYAGPQHLPVIGPNGVPLDTPEVAAGKAANAVAHAEAHARNGDYVAAPFVTAAGVVPAAYAAGVSPVAYAAGYAAPVVSPFYAGPQHLPVIGPNGVPLDTPEVAAGKAANTAAHIEAKVRNGDLLPHY